MFKGQPTGTVTLLMVGVEGSAYLWQTEPEETAAALPLLRATIAHLVALNDGFLRRGAFDSFVATFDRASDAVACALDLQRTPLDPFDLCIGVHSIDKTTGECAEIAGAASRLRDTAHGGQTLLSGATAGLVAEELPVDATLRHLGRQRHDDGLEPIFQLCHPALGTNFRAWQAPNALVAHHLLN